MIIGSIFKVAKWRLREGHGFAEVTQQVWVTKDSGEAATLMVENRSHFP